MNLQIQHVFLYLQLRQREDLAPKSGSNLTFNSSTGVPLTATKFSGDLNMANAASGTLSTARGGTGNTSGTLH